MTNVCQIIDRIYFWEKYQFSDEAWKLLKSSAKAFTEKHSVNGKWNSIFHIVWSKKKRLFVSFSQISNNFWTLQSFTSHKLKTN